MLHRRLLFTALFISTILLPRTSPAEDLLEVVSPKNFQKLYAFPVSIEIELAPEARRSTFQAVLNKTDITSTFEASGYGLKATLYLEDGLRFKTRNTPGTSPNVLQTRVIHPKSGKEVESKTFFFLEFDKLKQMGPKGGTLKSNDENLSIHIPSEALTAKYPLAITKLPARREKQPIYQLSCRPLQPKHPIGISLKYRISDLADNVKESDLFLVWEDDFAKALPPLKIKRKSGVLSTRFQYLTTAKLFLSFYQTMGKTAADIPAAHGMTLPVGDDHDAPYGCQSRSGKVVSVDGGLSPKRLIRSHYANSAYPKIHVDKGEEGCQWHVRTAFARNRSLNSPEGPTAGPNALFAETDNVLSMGEEWDFTCPADAAAVLPVRAIADGLVVYNKWDHGEAIVLAHRMNGIRFLSIYANRAEMSPCSVGTLVSKGEVIAKIGRRRLNFAIADFSAIQVDKKTEGLKVPATWCRDWTRAAIRDRYYDPTNFIFNLAGCYQWYFETEGNNEGWILENTKSDVMGADPGNGLVENGMLSFNPTSEKVHMTSYPLNIDAESFDAIFIKMDTTHPIAQGTVYFATPESPDFTEAQAIDFNISDEGLTEHKIFMADHQKWADTISRLRIAFSGVTIGKNVAISIDQIRLGRGFLSTLPDSGQVLCYDLNEVIPCPDPGEPFFGQDGNYLKHPPSYRLGTAQVTDTVFDEVTGLTWQRMYNNTPQAWSEAIGFSSPGTDLNWRLPTLKELQTLLEYGTAGACVDTSYFSVPTDDPEMVWSVTSQAYLARGAWALSLRNCHTEKMSKDTLNHVLPVMGRSLDFAQFKENGDGTVTDLATGLMWYKPETRERTWREALNFCEGLYWAGYDDWRLPNIKELQSLVNVQLAGPTLDTSFFPGCRPFIYWSSTTNAGHPEFAWHVDFDDGRTHGSGLKTREYYVRPVRSVYE